MIIKKISFTTRFLLVLLLAAATSFSHAEDEKGASKPNRTQKTGYFKSTASGKNGDSYRFNINNIDLPLDSRGVTAAVNIPPRGSNAWFGKSSFLFSGGFFISGYAKDKLFACAEATASLVENFEPGPVGMSYDPRAVMYVVKAGDAPFSQSWKDWSDAVALGADFYDGNGDGKYDPTDLNGNGKWDTNEDMPDLIGDEMVWCVYNDGIPSGQRTRFTGIDPQGIEIRQSVFGFASKGAIGNIIFVRYRIKNTGLKADTLKNTYFGVWADPDLGSPTDDYVGCDVARNAGFVYGKARDAQYGDNPPCFLIDFFSGPVSYIKDSTYTDNNGNNVYDEGVDTPLDTAYSVRGQKIGVITYPGATNLGISSFIHYQQGAPPIQDPNTALEARNLMLGLKPDSSAVDPCSWELGEVKGVDCSTIDNRFWYSGDPVTKTGWINAKAQDQRQMQNTGPFDLVKGKEIEIVVAYIVGQASTALGSVTEAKRIDDGAQFIFDKNFQTATPPPAPDVTVKTTDDKIELSWPTPNQVTYSNTTELYDMQFQGYNVYAFRINSTGETIDGQENIKLVATYDLKDAIKDVYKEDQDGVPRKLYPTNPDNQLDKAIYADPATGRIKFVIDKNPFEDSEDLIKGRPYFFAVTSYALNQKALKAYGSTAGDYVMSNKELFAEAENVYKIIPVTVGENLYDLTAYQVEGQKNSGGSKGKVSYEIVNLPGVTGANYEVSFGIDSTKTNDYSTFWNLKNLTTNQTLLDSMKVFTYGSSDISTVPVEGLIVKVSEEKPALGSLKFETKTNWVDKTASKLHYLAEDIAQKSKLQAIGGVLHTLNNKVIRADQLKRVEIRFDQPGKAYRYINGYYGKTTRAQQSSFVYAGALTAADTVGKGTVGLLGQGFVDVPFTAWVEDPSFGEKRQLTVGFIEKRAKDGGIPDGQWNPDTSLVKTGEYILVFNTTYDANGNQAVYKGGFADGAGGTVWADLNGSTYYKPPADAPLSAAERKIAASPFLNTLYAVGLEKSSQTATWSSSDKVVVEVSKYPYTPADKYTFTTNASGKLTSDQEKDIFRRVNVYPNPLFAYNVATSYTTTGVPDEPFVTFSNLPEEVTIKIYSLSGSLLRTLTTADKTSSTSPFLRWDLQNESGLRVASGMYLAIVHSPLYGDKVLKFAIIMPQKQLPKY